MRSCLLRPICLLAALLLAGPAAARPSAADRPGAGRPADEALREILVSGWMVAGWPDEQVVAELASIGSPAIESLFAIHAGTDQRLWEGEGLSYDRGPERGAYLAGRALCEMPRRDVLAFLRARVRPADALDVRLAAVGLYAALGTAEDLAPCLALVGSFGEEELNGPALRRRVPADLARLLARAPRAPLAAAGAYAGMPLPVRRMVLDALLALDQPGALDALPSVLGVDAKDDVRVLERLGQLGELFPWRLAEAQSELVGELLRDEDWRIRRAACVLAGSWREGERFDLLVGLFEHDPQPAVQRAALWALRALSASALDLDGEGWRRWHTAQSETWQREGEAIAAGLSGGDAAQASQAIRRAAQLPLQRDRTAPLVARVLARHPGLGETVSAVLVAGAERRAVPSLVDVMEAAPDPRARVVAWMTLKRLTGRDERMDDPSWTALVSD